MKRKLDVGSASRFTDADAETDSGDSQINPWTHQLYSSRYYEILQKRKQLPVYGFKQDLEDKIRASQVIVVEGETGSGIQFLNSFVFIILNLPFSNSLEMLMMLR